MNGSDYKIQSLKTILLLGIVVNHAYSAEQYIRTAQIPPVGFFQWVSGVLAVSGLPVFFFISGYFSVGKKISYREMLRKKWVSLGIPYLLWNSLFVAVYLIAGIWVKRLAERVEVFDLHSVWGVVNAILGITYRPLDAPLWFVRDLFLMFVFLPVLSWLVRKIPWLWFAALLVAMGFRESIECCWNFYGVVCFSGGIWLAEQKRQLTMFERYRHFLLPLMLILSAAVWGAIEYWQMDRIDRLRLMGYFYLVTIPCWLALMYWMDWRRESWFSRRVEPASFFIYAFHFMVCSSLLHASARLIPVFPFQMLTLYVIFVFCGGSLLLGLFHLTKRFAPGLLARFVGGRLYINQ